VLTPRYIGVGGSGWRGCAAILALFVTLLALPHPAGAQTQADKGRAVGLLKDGARLLNQKEFAAALEKFREAHRLVPSPKIQYNIGLAAEGLDRPAEAMRAYRAYLDAATNDDEKHQAHARARIAALRARVTFLDVTADLPGATVLVDGVDEGQLPLSRALVVNPGPHQVVVQPRGGETPWVRAIRGEAGGTVALQGQLSALTPARINPVAPVSPPATPVEPLHPSLVTTGVETTPPAESPPFYQRGWFWGATAGVVAVAAVVAVVLIKGHSTEFTCPAEPCLRGSR
jgi:hypothetical protein